MKQRYQIQVAGMVFPIVTEDEEDYTRAVARTVDERINSMVLKNTSCTKTKAAILCAMDYCSEAAQLKVKNEELEEKIKKLERALKREDVNQVRLDVDNT